MTNKGKYEVSPNHIIPIYISCDKSNWVETYIKKGNKNLLTIIVV